MILNYIRRCYRYVVVDRCFDSCNDINEFIRSYQEYIIII